MKQSRKTDKKKKHGAAVNMFSRAGAVLSLVFSGGSTVVGDKWKSGVTLSAIMKYACYSVMSLFLILLQTTFFTRFRPFGSAPDVLIVAVMVIGLFEDERAGAIFGVAVGYLADALGGAGVVLLPLVYMIAGYVCGFIASDYYKRSPLLFLIFDLAICVLRAFTTLAYILITWHGINLSVVLPSVIVPEVMSTFVVSFVPALLLLPIYLIFRPKDEKKPGLE